MASYQAPLRDMRFVLNDVFRAGEEWVAMPGTAEVTPDLADAILEEGARVTWAELFPSTRAVTPKVAISTPAASPHPRDSRRPNAPWRRAAGSAWAAIPNMADRVCPSC
ncbi:acyl-CoA dehydrogenase N-terminal domain-containing protein [Modicisalibacter luteus]|uniref:acyl-CoA dehydrogenase N-terminal domain-containing protein n=1 Tax=Modicisalibacter luteus TaxID=453962 RepID=UPI00362C4ADE